MIAKKDGISLKFFKHYYVVATVLEQKGWEVGPWSPQSPREALRARLADVIGGVLLKIGGEEAK